MISPAPNTATRPRLSLPRLTPTSTAQTGSVPINRLARAAEVRRIAQVWARNANTLQARPR